MTEKECCKNCRYCKKLNIYKRRIEEICSYGCVSGWKIGTNYGSTEESYCCTVQLDSSGIVEETLLNDSCELFTEVDV